jgi:dihydrofolate reductase
LKRQAGKDIWLCGAADLAASLFTEIDELILKVNPFLLGAGIPLFSRSLPKTDLELLNFQAYRNGFMRAHYRVQH